MSTSIMKHWNLFTFTLTASLSARRRDDDTGEKDTDEPSEKSRLTSSLVLTSFSALLAVLRQPSSTSRIFSWSPFTDAIICSSSFCGFSLLPLLYATATCEA